MKSLLYDIADSVQESIEKSIHIDLGKVVGMGADGTPTAQIDRIAEDVALRTVAELGKEVNVLSEESMFVDNNSDYTLVLDPIDGTHNAVHGIPFFSVSLAVGRNSLSNVEYALVRDLPRGDTYYAEKGKGAFLNGKRIEVSRFRPERSLFLVYLGNLAAKKSFQVASKARRVRCLGAASLDMCLVAKGSADLYYMNSVARNMQLRIMDIAASTLILREAGGEVLSLDSTPLEMRFDAKERSNLMAIGDRKVLEAIR